MPVTRMPVARNRYVLLCQQALACATVLVLGATASRVATLEIVRTPPGRTAAPVQPRSSEVTRSESLRPGHAASSGLATHTVAAPR